MKLIKFFFVLFLLVVFTSSAKANDPGTQLSNLQILPKTTVDYVLGGTDTVAYCDFTITGTKNGQPYSWHSQASDTLSTPGKCIASTIPTNSDSGGGPPRDTPLTISVIVTLGGSPDATTISLTDTIVLAENTAPSISDIVLNGQDVQALVTDSDGSVVNCSFTLTGPNDFTVLLGASMTPQGLCRARLPENTPTGTIFVKVSALDNNAATANVDSSFEWVRTPPEVRNITLLARTILFDVVDDYNNVTNCNITIAQNGSIETIPGVYSGTLRACSAVIPDDVTGSAVITARAFDGNNEAGQLLKPITVPEQPLFGSISQNGRTLSAAVTDSKQAETCTFDVYYSLAEVEQSSVPSSGGVISFAQPETQAGLSNPVVHYLALQGTITDSQICKADIPTSIYSARVRAEAIEFTVIKTLVRGTFAAPPFIDLPEPPVVVPPVVTPPAVVPPVVTPPVVESPVIVPPVVVPPAEPTPPNLLLQCSKNRLVVTDLKQVGKKALMTGYADPAKAGKTVTIKALFSKKTVGTAVVQADGSWKAEALLPAKKLIGTNKAMYKAELGAEKSMWLKLTRYLKLETITGGTGSVKASGRVEKRFPGQKIDVMISTDCGKGKTAANLKVDSKGRFAGTIKVTGTAKSVTIRLRTKAKNPAKKNKGFYTYTITQPVTIK